MVDLGALQKRPAAAQTSGVVFAVSRLLSALANPENCPKGPRSQILGF